MNKVFVIQDSPGKNLEPAKEYGEITIMLDGHEFSGEANKRLTDHLKDFQPISDYILLIGNPVFIALAGMIVSSVAHEHRLPINVLVWDKTHYRYNCEKLYA